MENYTNAILVRIDDDHIVTIDGDKYLVIDKVSFKDLNNAREVRVYTRTEDLQTAIFEILEKRPKLRSGQIRYILTEEYEMNPTPNTIRGLMGRMKSKGLLVVEGSKNTACWSIKKGRRLSDVK